MRRLDVEFQKAALRGVTILFAAGDDGIGSVDARTNPAAACTQSHPNFPSSSPWVTSVGGTQLSLDSNDKKDEVVCSAATGASITTGGGFSHLFPRPAYQQDHVRAYLAQAAAKVAPVPVAPPTPMHPSVVPEPTLLPPSTWFNASNRGFPDVSVLATNYEIVVGGRWVRTGGTSASAPVVAAMVSLWNEQLLAAGKPPLGFVNPWLYRQAQLHGDKAFRDVKRGSNACSQNRFACCPHGFGATTGWDAASGIGTPNFAFLQSQL
jgi:tripeptidyl-peptidase-1